MIRRAKRPETGYLLIRNDVLRDSRISFRSRGLLAAMLTFPDDWSFNRDWLAEQSPTEGQFAIRASLTELEQAGYLRRERTHQTGGRFTWEYVVYDIPQEKAQVTPSVGEPPVAQSSMGEPPVAYPPSYEVPTTNNHYEEELPPLASLATPAAPEALPGMPEAKRRETAPARRDTPAVDEMFEIFWQTYPRREGKQAARKSWSRATKGGVPAAKIIEGAERYARDPNREPQFTAHPSTWLNQGRWEDEPLPPRNGRPGNGASRLSVARDVTRQMQVEERTSDFGAFELPSWAEGLEAREIGS